MCLRLFILLCFLTFLVYPASSVYAVDCTAIPTEFPMSGPIGTLQPFQVNGFAYFPGALVTPPDETQCLGSSTENTYAVFPSLSNYRTCVASPGSSCGGGYYSGLYYVYALDVYACDTPPTPDPTGGCSDKALGEDEEGIDCGGPCSQPCEEKCPPGTTEFKVNNWDDTGESRYICAAVVSPDNAGNCPADYQKTKIVEGERAGQQICASPYDYIKTSPDVPPENLPPVDAPAGFGEGTVSVVESSPTTTTKNTSETAPPPAGAPAGTGSTVTTTYTTTKFYGGGGSGGKTTTTTTTTTKEEYYSGPDGTGSKLGESTTTSGTTSPEDEAGNYNYNPDLPKDEDVTIAPEEYGQGPDWNTIKTDIDSKLQELSDSITGSSIIADNPTCSISGYVLGTSVTFNFCKYQSILESMGTVLLALTYIGGFIYLFDRS